MQLFQAPPQNRFGHVFVSEDAPVYRVNENKFYSNEDNCLFEEGMVIEYDDEPNLSLEPMNNKAREKMAEFIAKIDADGREAAKKLGTKYIGQAQIAAALTNESDMGRARLLNGEPMHKKSILGAPRKGRPRKARLVETTPDMPTVHRVGVSRENTARGMMESSGGEVQ